MIKCRFQLRIYAQRQQYPRIARSYIHLERPVNIATLHEETAAHTASPRQILIHGFVRSIRKHKTVTFANIEDGSCLQPIQAVFTPAQGAELSNGRSITMIGAWHRLDAAKSPKYELRVQDVRAYGQHDGDEYPLQNKYQTAEYLRTIPHLRTRVPFNALLLRLRSRLVHRVSTFLDGRAFIQTHTPIITSSDCEGAGEVFTVDMTAARPPTVDEQATKSPSTTEPFFKTPRYLTVSSQLHLEAMAQSVGRVWTLSPAFRAEKSDTARHLSEFYMLEAEVAFAENLGEIMDLLEALLKDLAQCLQQSKLREELLLEIDNNKTNEPQGDDTPNMTRETLSKRWDALLRDIWPRITYTEAIKVLQEAVANGKAKFDFPPAFSEGLQAEHERYLAKKVGIDGPVFVTDYPRDQKPFYMAPSVAENESCETVACFDLLLPDVCEVAGGSMREHNYDRLKSTMLDKGLLDSEHAKSGGSLEWYLDLRRFGNAPHGGFGLGFDRFIGYLAGVQNIRDVVAFPRWHGRCDL